jgi:hypothetical protein
MHLLNRMFNPWITEPYNFQFLLYWKQMVKVKVKVKVKVEV